MQDQIPGDHFLVCGDRKKNMRRIAAGNRCMAAGVWGGRPIAAVIQNTQDPRVGKTDLMEV